MVTIREIRHHDNVPLARLIRDIFDEFDIPKEGTVYSDPDTDRLYELFQTTGSYYWVAEEDAVVIGGCGIYPTPDLPDGCAELVKFYLAPASRGRGIGKELMEKCFVSAKKMGYKELYLESFPQLARAVSMYEKAGFRNIEGPLGHSGHFACNVWMIKVL